MNHHSYWKVEVFLSIFFFFLNESRLFEKYFVKFSARLNQPERQRFEYPHLRTGFSLQSRFSGNNIFVVGGPFN